MFSTFGRSARLGTRAAAIALAALILASCGGGSDNVQTPPLFSTVVVVGASGTDTGNRCGVAADPLCFPAPPYAGRSTATNATSTANPGGKLYPELIAARYGATLRASSAGGTNYAIGGARTGVIPNDPTPATITNMQGQFDAAASRLNLQFVSRTLFIVDGSAFGNNIRRALELAAANPSQGTAIAQATVAQGATDIGTLLTRIYAVGGRHVVLANATDLGKHPAVVAAGPTAAATATLMSNGYNAALQAQVLPAIRAASPGLNIYVADFGSVMAQAIANPASFGLTNTAAPCYPYFSAPAAPACANPDQYFFWDELHPSATMHRAVSQGVLATMPSP